MKRVSIPLSALLTMAHIATNGADQYHNYTQYRRRQSGLITRAIALFQPLLRAASGFPTGSLLLIIGLMILSGCTSQPDTKHHSSARERSRPPIKNPEKWIGRWRGTAGGQMTIATAPDQKFRVTQHDDRGHTQSATADIVKDRLHFQRGDKHLAIRADKEHSSARRQCLTIVPGHQHYCRARRQLGTLPLKHGAYVNGRLACDDAQASETLLFDGHALKRPDKSACQTRLVRQQGSLFFVKTNCHAGRASGGRQTTIHIPDAGHMAVTDSQNVTRVYRYCPTHQLPPTLKNAITR